MKKRVKRTEKGFDSKYDYISTQVSHLKTSELELIYFIKVVDLFESFPLTSCLPNSDIRPKIYGPNTETMQKLPATEKKI